MLLHCPASSFPRKGENLWQADVLEWRYCMFVFERVSLVYTESGQKGGWGGGCDVPAWVLRPRSDYGDILVGQLYNVYMHSMPTFVHAWHTLTKIHDGVEYLDRTLPTFFTKAHSQCVGRNSSVGIATGYGLDGPGMESRWWRDFPHPSRPHLGPT